MLNIKTVYRKQLFENLKNARCSNPRTQKISETQKLIHNKKEEIKKNLELKKLITFRKEKLCMLAETNSSNMYLENVYQAFKYFNWASSKLPKLNFELHNVIDIFYSSNIPPIIKSKRNVIVVIENDKKKKNEGSKVTCPSCLKEQMMKELKSKIVANFKDMILLIRKKLLRGLKKKKKVLINEREKPGFLIMDDLLAPFPEMDTDPIPVFSFAEDKPQEMPKGKTSSERNQDSKKNSRNSTPQEMYYQWGKERSIKDEAGERSAGQEKSASNENPIFPPPHCPEDCLDAPENKDIFAQEVKKDEDSTPKINYNKDSLEIITEIQASDENRPPSDDKHINDNLTYKKSLQNKILNPPDNTDVVKDVSLSTLDLTNPSVAIIPIIKQKEKGKRNIIIKLKNVPDFVDVIKVRSIMTSIYNACEIKKYTNNFEKNLPKPSPYDAQAELARSYRRKHHKPSYNMTCPNKTYQKPMPKWFFESPYLMDTNITLHDRNATRRSLSVRMTNHSNFRSNKRNSCFYDE